MVTHKNVISSWVPGMTSRELKDSYQTERTNENSNIKLEQILLVDIKN